MLKDKLLMMGFPDSIPSSLACDLMGDIMVEILSRIPAKDLLRFRCVNKSWYTLVMSPFFIQMHCDYWSKFEEDNDKTVVGHDDDHNIGFMPPGSTKWEHTGIATVGRLIPVAGIIKGLICLSTRQRYGSKFLVMNLTLRKSKIIYKELVGESKQYKHEFVSFGFGFFHEEGDFKIIRIELIDEDSGVRRPKVDMYSLYGESWKEITCPMSLRITGGISIQSGNSLFWISNYGKSVTAFSLSSEKFYTIPSPGSVDSQILRIEYRNYDSIIVIIYEPFDNIHWVWKLFPRENPLCSGTYDFTWRRERTLTPEKVVELAEGRLGCAKNIDESQYHDSLTFSRYVRTLVPVNPMVKRKEKTRKENQTKFDHLIPTISNGISMVLLGSLGVFLYCWVDQRRHAKKHF